ncbi:MAG TPA: 4Fe-4S binding protein [Chitinispirillaceae bacterium]|nr:4Fe-4S binding protein [Chitinispirillaceae bacterium]
MGCSDSFEKQVMEPDTQREAFLRIDANKCTACGECFNSCPKKAISEQIIAGSYVYIIDPQLCIHCGICTEKCKSGAIEWKR